MGRHCCGHLDVTLEVSKWLGSVGYVTPIYSTPFLSRLQPMYEPFTDFQRDIQAYEDITKKTSDVSFES